MIKPSRPHGDIIKPLHPSLYIVKIFSHIFSIYENSHIVFPNCETLVDKAFNDSQGIVMRGYNLKTVIYVGNTAILAMNEEEYCMLDKLVK